MRFTVLLTAFLTLLLVAFQINAAEITGVEFYPENPSIGSGFIVVARVNSNVTTRVPWFVPACNEAEGDCMGQMLKSGDAYVCYFSNTDPKATCGPSPFSIPNYLEKFVIYAVDNTGSDPAKLETPVTTGSVTFNMHVQYYNESIKMQVFQQFDSVEYKVYDESMNEKTSGSLTMNEYGTFTGEFVYDETYKFIVFSGTGPSGSAGAALPVPQPESETSEETPTESTLPVVEAEDVNVYDGIVKQGDEFKYEKPKITNKGVTDITNLRIVVPDNLKEYLVVTPKESSLRPNETTRMLIVVPNIQGHTEISTKVEIFDGETKAGEAKVNIIVSVIEGNTVLAKAPTATPSLIRGGVLVNTELTKSVSIRNNHESPISISSFSSDDLGSTVSMEIPDESIPVGGSKSVDIVFKSSVSGAKTGLINIETTAGNAVVYADITFYSNMTDAVSMAQTRLDSALMDISEDKQTTLSDIIDGIESDLTSADAKFSNGDYEEGQNDIDAANIKIAMLQDVADVVSGSTSTGSGCTCDLTINCDDDCWCDPECTNGSTPSGGNGFDFTIVIIIVIIALAGFGVWYYMTKIRKTGWEGEIEDDF